MNTLKCLWLNNVNNLCSHHNKSSKSRIISTINFKIIEFLQVPILINGKHMGWHVLSDLSAQAWGQVAKNTSQGLKAGVRCC